jgi:rhodanese-related sulfurtransferase
MRTARTILVEALVVAVLGVAFALVANTLSPRGLRLSRNYFPRVAAGSTVAIPAGGSAPSAVSSHGTDALSQRLAQRGLQLIGSNDVIELFRDPRYEQGLIVFVDARNDQHYADGHIPGAWQLDHYRPENYLPAVLQVCLTAMKVVVYCNGGECEDSEFAAVMLRDAGVPANNLWIYAGGITEWKAQGFPLEPGARGGLAKP